MNPSSHGRNWSQNPRFWAGTALIVLIMNICRPTVAQLTIRLPVPPLKSASVNTDLGCDRLQDGRRSAAFAPKILREQRAQWALGSKLAADVDRNYELITDHFILQYVNRLERTIVNESELPGCFVVKVLIDPEANAYSLPGGFIYLTTGLIALVESEGQLVAALAHETGHITGQHLTRIDGQARTLRGVLFFGGPVGFALWRSVGRLVVLKLMRNKEFEADRLGLRYEIASGYEPLEFCRFLQLVFRKEEQSEPFFDRLNETHPSTNVRVRRLRASSSDLRAHQPVHIVNTSEFSEMKKHFSSELSLN
ncbi:MAG: hypothetical protein DMG79_08320 [Acidobacteria bacterium]|nr:MAG: hypothetical protein DMG79_08320 [Acidobacteriota bacterium]